MIEALLFGIGVFVVFNTFYFLAPYYIEGSPTGIYWGNYLGTCGYAASRAFGGPRRYYLGWGRR